MVRQPKASCIWNTSVLKANEWLFHLPELLWASQLQAGAAAGGGACHSQGGKWGLAWARGGLGGGRGHSFDLQSMLCLSHLVTDMAVCAVSYTHLTLPTTTRV